MVKASRPRQKRFAEASVILPPDWNGNVANSSGGFLNPSDRTSLCARLLRPMKLGENRKKSRAMEQCHQRSQYVDMPSSIRNTYQSLTQASMQRLQHTGCNLGFTRLEDARHTLTALPALPELGLLPWRDPCPCIPLHTHTSPSGKSRRCCVDRLIRPCI
jgi:hypothetical protein